MVFTDRDFESFIATMPDEALLGITHDQKREWIEQFTSLDTAAAQGKHDISYYGCLARLVGEKYCATDLESYQDPDTRNMIMNLVTVGEKPYEQDIHELWNTWTVSGAQRALTLRFVQKAHNSMQVPGPTNSSDGNLPSAVAEMSSALLQYAAMQKTELDIKAKKGTLPYDVEQRMKEVGLADLTDDAKPTEEALLKIDRDSSQGCP